MSKSQVLVANDETGIFVLTLNRPEKRNALNVDLITALTEEIVRLNQNRDARVIVLGAAGKVFCAGLDLHDAVDSAKRMQTAESLAQLLGEIYHSPLVTIAAVQGAALAGGVGLMSACDFAVAGEDCVFGLPEVRRGLIAALIMSLVRRQLCERDTKELLLLGNSINSARAKEMGLINRIVPENKLHEEAITIARTAMLGAPAAIAQTKKHLDSLWHGNLKNDLQNALNLHGQECSHAEAQEGINSFFEKRHPNWHPGAT